MSDGQAIWVTVFENDREGNTKRPRFTGYLTLDGVDYEFPLFDGTTKKGKACLSGKLEPKGSWKSRPAEGAAPQKAPVVSASADYDDIPF